MAFYVWPLQEISSILQVTILVALSMAVMFMKWLIEVMNIEQLSSFL